MDEIRRILVIILCGLSAVTALSVKGYFCRDPDTGKLYPANSTWPSTTFCGNYTCKLRKKPPPQSEPLREFNITNVNTTPIVQARSHNTPNDGEVAASNITPQIVIPTDTPNSIIDKTLFSSLFQNELNSIQEKLKQNLDLGGSDRFLTDSEIKTISDLLHSVRKSDLEAIVDIYSLAQDIYKEMDKVTSENIIEETMRIAQSLKAERGSNKHISYWYEPVNRYNKAETKSDMDQQGTNLIPTTAQPRSIAKPNSYFAEPLSRTDFGKLPYYYPMSSFQRQSSYVHPTYNPQSQPSPANVKPPCSNNNLTPVAYPQPSSPYNYPPPQNYPLAQNYRPIQNNPPAQNYPAVQTYPAQNYPAQSYPPQNYGVLIKRPFTVETQKLINPSVLLPYPFSYVQHYNNMSSYPFNMYYAENPWARFDVNNKNSIPPKTNTAQSQNNAIPDADTKEASKPKSEVDKTNSNLLETLVINAKNYKKPEWQTDPLPKSVLDEVRAHFEEKSKLLKPFSLRKKVKLERVGKVVKLDDLHREKRSIDNGKNLEVENADILEAYIEKTTCQSDIDPGFFRVGNLSEPYPACCPQRIDNNSR